MPPPVQRGTRQRAAIRAVVAESPRPLLPTEIQERAQLAVAGLALATIYRNLKLLVEENEVRIVELPGEAPRFESAHRGHHHHFQCRTCERVFDVHECPGDFAGLAPKGFKVEAHELTLYGLCADCGKLARQPVPKAGSKQH
ncbi:transcriptional repressor [Variovorax sp. J22R187]|nr:transcriptional repressor [Variovorax sp. J22R187]MDM0018852.1 transcriptional repressor [Variovorax sp. J22R187]